VILIKNDKEVKIMAEGGKKLWEVLDAVLENLRPGMTTLQLDRIAEEKILSLEAKPSFKMVPGYHWTTCITLNDEVVHGIPGEKEIRARDVVGIDIGCYYQNFHTDKAVTVTVGENPPQAKFLQVGKMALEKAIEKARPGNYLGEISLTIQKIIETAGYSPVRVLTGHGVGRDLHEDPSIPCFLFGDVKKTLKLKAGMTLAIEVIYNQGSGDVVLRDDGWTIATQDGKISGLFEETVAVTTTGPLVLTRK